MINKQPGYVPLGDYLPEYSEVENYTESKFTDKIPGDVMGVFHAANHLSIRQHMKLLPLKCLNWPPCVKQPNTYSVYAGLKRDQESEFLRVDEVSEEWNRCCCSPYHPLKLEVRQFIPPPGSGNTSDFDNLMGDVKNDWSGFSGSRKQEELKKIYKKNPILFTIIREDGMRCCRCPCKCLSTFVCCTCCRDGVKVYAGELYEYPDCELGRVSNEAAERDVEKLMGSALQPHCHSDCCTPTIHLRDQGEDDSAQPFGKVEGPYCFGGMSEFCYSFKFAVTSYLNEKGLGDMAVIKKKKPESMSAGFQEAFSDADNYTIVFNPELNLTPEQKATILSSQLLADYMYFDGNTEKVHADSNGITFYCFYCSCLGEIVPCCCHIPYNN